MNRQENKIVRQCPQQAIRKVLMVFAVVTFSWLSASTEESQAQRSRVYRPYVGPVAEKPLPPIRGSAANAPEILSITNTKKHRITISFRDFAAKVSSKKFELERQTVGSSAWHAVYTMTARDHRIPFDPRMRDHRRQPGAKYVHHDTTFLVTGRKYRYRVRATIPYEPQPMVLLSAVRTITLKPVESETLDPPDLTPPDTLSPPEPTPHPTPPGTPTPPNPAPPEPTPTDPTLPTVDTKTIYLKARRIGSFLRPYVAIFSVPGEITEVEIPEVDGKPLQVYFMKPGYKLGQSIINPNVTVRLRSGQTSTPEQISELFGTAQKGRFVKLVAFVRASQGNHPKSIAIKVSSIKSN